MNFIKNIYRKIKLLFNNETTTIEKLQKVETLKEVQNELIKKQKQYDDLESDYLDMKKVLFSPLHSPNEQSNLMMFVYIILALSVVSILISLFK